MRKFAALATALAIVLVSVSLATAGAFRTAKVGDSLGDLTMGLNSFDIGPSNICDQDVELFGYVQPNDQPITSNAVEAGIAFNGNLRAVATIDPKTHNFVSLYVADMSGTIVAVFQYPISDSDNDLACQASTN